VTFFVVCRSSGRSVRSMGCIQSEVIQRILCISQRKLC